MANNLIRLMSLQQGLPLLTIATAALLLNGCSTLDHVNGVPEWITKSQKVENLVCAVGASEPTFYVEDAKSYAAESARKELARSLSLEIKSIMVDVATNRGSDLDEAGVVQISSWATGAVLRESKIVEHWYDEKGMTSSGKKGMTYVLACMPRQSTEEIAQKIKIKGAD